jgi:hypothetical protein
MPDRLLLLLECATSALLLLASGLLLLLLLVLAAVPLVLLLLLLLSAEGFVCGEVMGTTLPASTSSWNTLGSTKMVTWCLLYLANTGA